MAYAGDGQTLLGGGGGQKGTGAAEKDPFQFAAVEPIQKVAAEGDGAAAAAGAAGVNILHGVVKNQRAAICQLATQTQPVQPGKLQKGFLTKLSQVAGDDEVKVIRRAMQIIQMGPDGGVSRRGKCQG